MVVVACLSRIPDRTALEQVEIIPVDSFDQIVSWMSSATVAGHARRETSAQGVAGGLHFGMRYVALRSFVFPVSGNS
jgi:hypothetical protein